MKIEYEIATPTSCVPLAICKCIVVSHKRAEWYHRSKVKQLYLQPLANPKVQNSLELAHSSFSVTFIFIFHFAPIARVQGIAGTQ
jgi:hypothetical protein